MSPRLGSSSVLPLFLFACSRSTPSTAVDDASATAPASASAVAPVTDAGVVGDGGRPSASGRSAVLKALQEGRSKSRAKDYAGALAAFDRALAIAPNDGRVLAEIGWAALQSGDLARAERANRRGLAIVKDKILRAQILYNTGRVAEARKDNDAARSAYTQSLVLRENTEVKRRLVALGGAPPPPPLACEAGAPDVEGLCKCLLASKAAEAPPMDPDEKPICRALPVSLSLGTPRLSVIHYGSPSLGERVHLLVARDGGVLRPVIELGHDFQPGAFGVDNTAEVKGGEARKLGGRTAFVIKTEQRNIDQNLAGLEVCTEEVDLETVCALGEGDKPTRCVNVPVRTTAGCGPGAEPEPGEADDEVLATAKKGWGQTTTRLTWSVASDGKLSIKEVAPPLSSTKHELVGSHPLF